MKKLLAWMIDSTRIGPASKKIQEALEGKKQMLGGLAAAIPATVLILNNYAKSGTPYLLELPTTVEFATASGGWIAFFNALKGEKTRNEIQELKDMIQPTQTQGETK